MGLRRSDLKEFVEAFIKAFSDSRPQAGQAAISAFTEAAQGLQQELAEHVHDQETRRLAARAVKLCEQLLKQSRAYHVLREAELGEMIAMLRRTSQQIAGESVDFTDEMRATSERFLSISQVEDIRELKQQLTAEASTLQRVVADKQRRDQHALSELSELVKSLQAQVSQVEEQASTDPLTKIANRRTFDEALVELTAMARKAKAPLTLAMIDIDHFKTINDTYGHPIGDRVLLCAAQWLSAAIRANDLAARYGGEEFAVILPNADLAAAERRFLAFVADISGRAFEYEADGQMKSLRFTVSCGLTELSPDDTDRDLVRRADRALYDAKKHGRNRVVTRKRGMLDSLFG